ncbi:hypothetical protein C5D07_00595 [Rathayibacter tritici]|uniref:alpha/beta hydrolase n=1 Tax=Rathayibacter tritici TaxID=33888 RepID=UPI000CE85208|nr:alpha/beta hydrolase [Rathayibacter tritici]PPF30791.1 hypothetical protein C5C06_04275 [Rathayibacter tritici]PPI20110.1 hypothetical protein C5D07_00595 [Rathayibacter tritici]
MEFRFDDATADDLAKTLRNASDSLRDHGVAWSGAMGTAVEHFTGPYADLFRTACIVGSENRVGLSRSLWDLADRICETSYAAQKERARIAALEAWNVREAEREQRRRSHPLAGLGVQPDEGMLVDPRPSEDRIPAPVINAGFAIQEPPRTTTQHSGPLGHGRTSADPDDLVVYASTARAFGALMQERLTSVRASWASFTDACSWVPIENCTFLNAFERFVTVNGEEASWVEAIADAFRAAGGGSLSSAGLDLARTRFAPPTDQALRAILASVPAGDLAAMLAASPALAAQIQRMPPAVVHEWWQSLDPAADSVDPFSSRQHELLTALPLVIGNLEGIPYGARSVANAFRLEAELASLTAERDALRAITPGTGSADAVGPALADIERRLAVLANIHDSLASFEGRNPRFLISLTDDDPPLAAVSIGDLDTATDVTYAVPGMGQTTATTTDWTRASQNLQSLLPPGHAVVAWIGYETPPNPIGVDLDMSVLTTDDAVAGATRLAAALGGLAAVRGDSIPHPNVVAHSYGSTVAAVAATRPDVQLGSLITLGSAGLPDSVDNASDLHADGVYAGQGRPKFPGENSSGDELAYVGRGASEDHHVNPVLPGFGAHVFGVENGGDNGRPVSAHGAVESDTGDRAGYFDVKTESLNNVARILRGDLDSVTDYVPLGPTELQKRVGELVDGD